MNWARAILAVCVQGEKYVIDDGVEVVATPGHTSADISLVVQNTTRGTVLLAGKFANTLFILFLHVCYK